MTRAGYVATELHDRKQAAAWLRNNRPAAAILDAALFVEMKQSNAAPEFPCIVFDADPRAELVVAAFRAGAMDFFQSKDSPEEIAGALQLALADGGHHGTPSEIQALVRAKEAAEAINRAKSEFLATMNHELRTPLNAIIGFSDLMAKEALGPLGHPNYRAYIEDIRASGRHLLEIINDVLEFSKVETGRLTLTEDFADVHYIAQAVMRLVSARAREGGVQVENAIPAGLPQLWCDMRKLRQMLLNLAGNAVKFTSSGGVVSISAQCSNAEFVITVADNGIGIAGDDLPRVLQPFVQGNNALSRHHAGAGLGLTLVKSMIEKHGGSLRLESQPGQGTKVHLVFPGDRIGASATGPATRKVASR